MPEPHNVVFHRRGPQWKAGVPAFGQDGMQLHVTHYRQWMDQGKLLLGGPFLDEGGGGMMGGDPRRGPGRTGGLCGR